VNDPRAQHDDDDGGFDDVATSLQPRADATPRPTRSLALVVIEGPDRGKRFAIDGCEPSRPLVGQSPACAIRLADREVSRRHAAFELTPSGLAITDLGSTNGTFIDGVRVVEAFAQLGSVVRLGSTAFRVDLADRPGERPIPATTSFGRVIGGSSEMRRLYPLCERLAATLVPVLIEGETGTGKEVLAEALHERGPRAGGPFVVFDCTAVPANLVEAELFGHERGAFTGAHGARKGLFEQAHGGALLIDEIGDLDLALQPKLLRAVERGELRRIGGDRPIKVDVRILAATRRDLDHEVAAGRFRDDLFHRLVVARLELPPLRERRGDVPLLVRHFCAELGGDGAALPASLLRRWEDERWPGNIRELRNAVARHLALGELAAPGLDANDDDEPAAALAGGDIIDAVLVQDLPIGRARQKVVDHFERRYIARVLAAHGGNVVRAAEASGLARRYFQILRSRKAK
jgi:transcriptional regulator with GAF, ATPase, and Fis domain